MVKLNTMKGVMARYEPSLTLSLSGLNRTRGAVAGSSSRSSMSVKRELEVGNEESERVSIGNNYSTVMSEPSGDDDGCVNETKARTSKGAKAEAQAIIFYERTKLKQTEMDFEHMKKLCDKLTCENQKLQKELQELKALKSSQPFYMQLQAAGVTMCPSCQWVTDTKSSIVNSPNFTLPAKPNVFNSLNNPSAAC
ncbi:hypothetical protein E3N88_30078 [Mikania micrantha]|uniref:Leucine zipper homeobox-associated domain-containing protein n=1 Tax=Mikania micrantha TaxID=192012 RepID=A0A5N6MKK1_9ASTR|nr:hypothetical protein E3N88_30078 [Mikania micrantha]